MALGSWGASRGAKIAMSASRTITTALPMPTQPSRPTRSPIARLIVPGLWASAASLIARLLPGRSAGR